jgi:hypothetical protein
MLASLQVFGRQIISCNILSFLFHRRYGFRLRYLGNAFASGLKGNEKIFCIRILSLGKKKLYLAYVFLSIPFNTATPSA